MMFSQAGDFVVPELVAFHKGTARNIILDEAAALFRPIFSEVK